MNAMLPLPESAETAREADAEARAMTERLLATDQRSTAELLEQLRRSFPDSPLSVRVRALAALRKR